MLDVSCAFSRTYSGRPPPHLPSIVPYDYFKTVGSPVKNVPTWPEPWKDLPRGNGEFLWQPLLPLSTFGINRTVLVSLLLFPARVSHPIYVCVPHRCCCSSNAIRNRKSNTTSPGEQLGRRRLGAQGGPSGRGADEPFQDEEGDLQG